MRVAFPTNKGEKIARHSSFCRSFLIVDIKTGEREMVDNPLKKEAKKASAKANKSTGRHLGAGRIISVLLADADVDLYVYLEAEKNFLSHLQREGIGMYKVDEKTIEKVFETVEIKEDQIQENGLGKGRGFGRGTGRGQGLGRRAGRGRGRSLGKGTGLGQGNGRGLGNR